MVAVALRVPQLATRRPDRAIDRAHPALAGPTADDPGVLQHPGPFLPPRRPGPGANRAGTGRPCAFRKVSCTARRCRRIHFRRVRWRRGTDRSGPEGSAVGHRYCRNGVARSLADRTYQANNSRRVDQHNTDRYPDAGACLFDGATRALTPGCGAVGGRSGYPRGALRGTGRDVRGGAGIPDRGVHRVRLAGGRSGHRLGQANRTARSRGGSVRAPRSPAGRFPAQRSRHHGQGRQLPLVDEHRCGFPGRHRCAGGGRMKDLVGRIALVTGGGKGVGKVIARDLAERGAHVLINCFHSYDRAKQTQAELTALGARVDILRASVARKDQVDRMFDEIEERFGFLDILVNNAASGSLGPVDEITPEHFAKAIDANLQGSFWCAKRASPLMARRGGGTIVNISSVGAGLVPDNYLVVGTSKAAVEALTRHLAAEFAPLGIRVNTASCSLIRGEVAELFPRAAEMQEVGIASTPLGRLATPEDLTGVVTFLTSDLSRWVTGQVVLADGGLSLANAMLSPPRRPTPLRVTDAPMTPPPNPLAPPADAPSVLVSPAADAPAVPVPPAADGDDPVVVVGMGLAVPGANSPQQYWRLLQEGAELFVETPTDRWDASAFYSDDTTAEDKGYQKCSGFITDFAPDPALAAEIDAGTVGGEFTTRWLRHSLHQALHGVGRRDDERVLFAVGYTADGSQHLEEAVVLSGAVRGFNEAAAAIADPAERDEAKRAFREAAERHLWRGAGDPSAYLPHKVARNAMTGLLPDETEVLIVDTACSSSLYAADFGMRSLLLGDCDVAVCGGAFALGPRGAVLFSRLHGLSTGGAVRSLDRGADGVLFSDGAGVIVLKRLSRATADGDRVLGVLRGFGSSSDGRGKAIYAPSTKGQQLAVQRAMSSPGVTPGDLSWVLAHATGTPAGDVAEFTTLREALPADQPMLVTSNKSLIGHTGWAAGVVSLIEILLAFEHSATPAQHRFEAAPAAFELESSSITIPTQRRDWPAGERPRTASISGFGFGGTNAHLVVAEPTDHGRPTAPPYPSRDDDVVVVGWSAHFPGLADPDAVAAWLLHTGPAPERSFGPQYRLPAQRKIRIPPSAQRVLDRGQLMAVECMFQLTEQFGTFFEQHAATTGVLAGHMGPTGHAGLYALRCYLDDLRSLLEPGVGSAAYEAYAEQVRAAVPAATEDAFPGIMPNIIPARVANIFD